MAGTSVSERDGSTREKGALSFSGVIHFLADEFLGFQPIFHVALPMPPPLLIEFVGFLRNPFPHLIRILLHGLRLGREVSLLQRLGVGISGLHEPPSFDDVACYP